MKILDLGFKEYELISGWTNACIGLSENFKNHFELCLNIYMISILYVDISRINIRP